MSVESEEKTGMLVLQRNIGEKVIITFQTEKETLSVEVIVTSLDKGKVKLGFIAPRSIVIDREEIWLKKNKS